MNATTPKGLRLHIGFFGRRNVGKSSLLNAITRQQVSIVSPIAGTTTDPVEKPMELLPLGPVLFIDTAGIDDAGSLGALRVEKTRQVLDRVEVAVLVTEGQGWGEFEEQILAELGRRQTPVIVVLNKIDAVEPSSELCAQLAARKLPVVLASALRGTGLLELRQALLAAAPPDFINSPAILGDLVGPGGLAVLVVPIDKEAPKGDLTTQVEGALAVEALRAGDRVLIAEACAHHPIGEDIGRVKIPRWLTQYVGGKLEFVHVQGHDFPADLSPFRLVVHCGACLWNRREMLSRILRCRQAGVPITNYGLAIAYSLGIFERALAPFPAALAGYRAGASARRAAP